MLKKLLIGLSVVLILLAGGFVFRLFSLAQQSPNVVLDGLGMEEGHLKKCGDKPNCVSTSAAPESEFYIEPLVSQNIEGLWDDLNIAIHGLGYKVVKTEGNYLHVTATTKIFGFIDDLEFHMIPEEGLIEMRSQSRVGYSDLGANRKRLEKLRQQLQPKK